MAKRKHVSKVKDQPHSVEAEQGLLGSVLVSPKIVMPEVIDKLSEEDFFIPSHKIVYNKMKAMYDKGQSPDLITFTQFLRDEGALEEAGGVPAVTALLTYVPSAANFKSYLEIVKDQRLLRDLIERSEKTINYCTAKGDFFSVPEILSRAQLAFGEMQKFNATTEKSLGDFADEKMQRMMDGEPDDDKIFTRITELDRLSPLRKGDMPIIKAFKKVGKSTLALSITENVCIQNGLPALYFSLEDRMPKVMDRLLAGVSRIPSDKHHIKKLTEVEMTMVRRGFDKIIASKMKIVDDVFDLAGMIAKARKYLIDFPNLALVVVDYAQLVDVEVKKSDTREREVAVISRTWRKFAMETGVTVILVSQVNSDGESRESRALEQDCTACWALKDDLEPSERTLSIEFQRDGESHVSFPVRFLGPIHRVENAAQNPA